MAVIQANDTKQRIIEKLEGLPAEKLGSVLDYVQFLSLGRDAPDWELEPGPLSARELELSQEALNDHQPDVPHSEVRKMLGM
jgi:hypothetical protein